MIRTVADLHTHTSVSQHAYSSLDEMARSAELQAKAVFHASRLPTAAAVSPMDLSIEAEAFGVTCGTEDKNEGMGAFLEKRAEKHFQNR